MEHTDMDVRRRAFFDEHADGWLDTFYLNPETGKYDKFEQEFARLFDIVGLKDGDIVLDAGCGCGILVPYILDRIGPSGALYEVDYAEKMIEVNRRLHDDNRIRFMPCSVDDADIPAGSLDNVICFSCFPHFQNKPKTLDTLNTFLRPGGILTIAHFDSSEGINDHHRKHECVMHDHLPQEQEMRSLLANAGFDVDLFTDEPGFYAVRAVKN